MASHDALANDDLSSASGGSRRDRAGGARTLSKAYLAPFRKTILAAAITGFALINAPARAAEPMTKPVIEVVTLRLKPSVTPAQFAPIDKAVEEQHVSKQPGFLSRESAPGAGGRWLVIVHWRSIADADASMKSFSTAPAAAQFMEMIVPESMTMTRYGG